MAVRESRCPPLSSPTHWQSSGRTKYRGEVLHRRVQVVGEQKHNCHHNHQDGQGLPPLPGAVSLEREILETLLGVAHDSASITELGVATPNF